MSQSEPLLFKPFKGEIKESFERWEVPHSDGVVMQNTISLALDSIDNKLEVKVLRESIYKGQASGGGSSLRLSPKQVIVLRELLAKVDIEQNAEFYSVPFEKKSSSSSDKQSRSDNQ